MPDGQTGHDDHAQPPQERGTGFLLPLLGVHAGRFQQFVKRFNAPSPSVPSAQHGGGCHRCVDVGQQTPFSQYASRLIDDSGHDQAQWNRWTGHVDFSLMATSGLFARGFFGRPMQHDGGFRDHHPTRARANRDDLWRAVGVGHVLEYRA